MTWDPYECDRLTDFVFDSNLSTFEIAKELGKEQQEVTKKIRDLGLSWVRRKKGHISRGQAALTSIMQKLLPGEEILTEYPLVDRLRLDVYCPAFSLAAEYHGKQHFIYTPFFHGDKEGFLASQERDDRKEQVCKEMGIALVTFRYNDLLTEDAVFDRMMQAIRDTPHVANQKKSRYIGNPFYEERKARNREYRKAAYAKMKASRKRD